MPDTKITALTAIGANPIIPATFPIPMVDLTDTSMAASGTTKKVTVNQILGAGGTATLASATITGDLTVRTNKLVVNATGVAIGAASASYPLDVSGTSRFIGDAYLFSTTGGSALSKSLIFGSAANISAASIFAQTATANSGILYLATQTGGVMTDRLSIDSSGVFTFQNVGGVAGTAMTLNATGLGVGDSPSYKLHVARNADGTVGYFRRIGATINPALTVYCNETGNTVGFGTDYAGATSPAITFTTAGTERLRIDSSGRLLVGSTTAFTDLTGSKEVKIGDGGIQTFSSAIAAATPTNIARGGVGGLVYVGGFNGTGQYGAVVLWTSASATVVSVINNTGSTITFGVSAGFLQITSSLALTTIGANCIRL